MLTIETNKELQDFNTFSISAKVDYFLQVNSLVILRQLLKSNQHPIKILGGGSNILLTGNIEGLIIQNNIKGLEVIQETPETVLVAANGGEDWHEFVLWTLEKGYFGLENLSLIPGKVGTAPIQNIGAYGIELKDRFYYLEAIDLATGEDLIFYKNDCQFGYRDSIFKKSLKHKIFIHKVVFCLSKTPDLHIGYGAIQQVLQQNGIHQPTPQDVSNAVIEIREKKLPDPKILGNAGSFFKNPVISTEHFLKLKAKFPHIVAYKISDTHIKIPAGWLIEQAGWKGKVIGHCGSHKNQALVLVNYGGATGSEILRLAKDIQESILELFEISLQPEVNIW